MTREEFKSHIDSLSLHLTYPELDHLHAIDESDAEQRAEIVRLVTDNNNLAKFGEDVDNELAEIDFDIYEDIGTLEIIRTVKRRVDEQNETIARLREALELYKNASYQSHNGHWDMTMQGGTGCPECIRARELRGKADEILANDDLKETP